MLIGGGFRGRTTHTLWVKHHKRLQTGGYDRKKDGPMEGSVLASSTKHKNSRRPEKVSPGTGVCPLGSAQPCWCPIPCFLRRTDVGSNTAQASPALGDHSQCPPTVGQPEEGWVGLEAGKDMEIIATVASDECESPVMPTPQAPAAVAAGT